MKTDKPLSSVRWTVCALIFVAMTVNYLDRQIFSLLIPFFENDLKLGPTDLALINVSFLLPYGLAMIFVGRYIDRVGIKRGLGVAYLLWSLASMGHALVRGLTGFMGIRFLLGIGESGMYPAGIKTMTEWFPRKERSFATGLFNAGANCGAILAPLLGVGIAEVFGWRTCFMITGGVGLIWLLFWGRIYSPPETNQKVSSSELAYIQSDGEPQLPPISYSQLFGMRPIYGLAIGKALSDAPFWLYLTWMPKFLVDQFHVTPKFMALAIPVIYIVADIGSIFGGWLSTFLISRGRSVGYARKLTMFVCAVAVVPVMSIGSLVDRAPILGVPCVFWAVGIVAVAAGAHQGWSCNLFTMISDVTPKNAVALAVGAINGFAMIGVSAMQLFVGRSVQLTSSYTLPFLVAGSLYLVALLVIQVFIPKVEPNSASRRASIPIVVAGAVAVLAALGWLLYSVNRPPYASVSDYLSQRGSELGANAEQGPAATVGWMQAQWIFWHPTTGEPKLELIKLDSYGHPFIESKGTKAAHYEGPPSLSLEKSFHIAP